MGAVQVQVSTHVWGRQLTPDKLRLYMRVAPEEGAAMAKREGKKAAAAGAQFPGLWR